MLRIILTVTLAALVVAAPVDLDPNHADESTEEVVHSKRAVDSMGPSWQQRGADQFMQNDLIYQQRAAADSALYKDPALMMQLAPQQRAVNQQMYYQPDNIGMIMQQRAVLEAANQMYGRQNEEPMSSDSSMSPPDQQSNQAFGRSAYGAVPLHTSVTGGYGAPAGGYGAPAGGYGGAIRVGVFPNQLNGGGCGNAIPLLLSCTPNLVQGHILPMGHGAGAGVGAGIGGLYTPNLALNGIQLGVGNSPHSGYGAPSTAYRATADSPSEASQSAGSASKPNEVSAAHANSN